MNKDNRFKGFQAILNVFWKYFKSDLIQFSPITDNDELDRIQTDLQQMKDDFNVDVHQLGAYNDRDSLEQIQSKLQNVVDFLWHISEHIN